MTTATTIALMLVRVTGLINLVLGVLFWTHHAQYTRTHALQA